MSDLHVRLPDEMCRLFFNLINNIHHLTLLRYLRSTRCEAT